MLFGLIIFGIVTVAFLSLVARYGADTRDGHDWWYGDHAV